MIETTKMPQANGCQYYSKIGKNYQKFPTKLWSDAGTTTHAYRDKGVILFNQNIKDGYLNDSDISL